MANNRIAGAVLIVVGIGWFATWPAFLWWMTSMEASAKALAREPPDEAAWRLWRALENLLIEPKWLAYTLSVLLLGAYSLGIALLTVGIATLRGNARAPKWAAVVTVSGMIFYLIGFVFHWAFLMPTVNASENLEVVRASGDLNLAIPVALGIGIVILIMTGFVLLATRRKLALPGKDQA